MGRAERRKARVERLERLARRSSGPSAPLPAEAQPMAAELLFLSTLDDPADAERRSLLALQLHALTPLPGRPDHPSEALREHLAHRLSRSPERA
jgi:hypothetical protein